jgi:hypothetical protein
MDEMSMIEPCWLDYLDVMVGSPRVAFFMSFDACQDFLAIPVHVRILLRVIASSLSDQAS